MLLNVGFFLAPRGRQSLLRVAAGAWPPLLLLVHTMDGVSTLLLLSLLYFSLFFFMLYDDSGIPAVCLDVVSFSFVRSFLASWF